MELCEFKASLIYIVSSRTVRRKKEEEKKKEKKRKKSIMEPAGEGAFDRDMLQLASLLQFIQH